MFPLSIAAAPLLSIFIAIKAHVLENEGGKELHHAYGKKPGADA